MKIDKVIFSTSERFSCFWNLVSRVYRTKLDIEPVCLLLGDRRKTNVTEEFGKVIEVPIRPDKPLLIQITWSKFFWPTLEPDTTWLIGDIDLLPLCTHWFTTNIADVPDHHYVHLDADGITQLNGTPWTWCGRDLIQCGMMDFGCPTNMPGHYHCGKGSTLKRGLEIVDGFEEELNHIIGSGKYNNVRAYRECDPIDQANLWCAEELRSTAALRRQIAARTIDFTPFSLRHGIDRIDGDRLDKCMYDMQRGIYHYDHERLSTGKYADLHCIRPFSDICDPVEQARRWRATEDVLSVAGML